jgi:uncharacterized protein (DUF58 family)
MAAVPADSLAAVRVSVPALVELNQAAAGLTLGPARIRAQMSGDYVSRLKGRGMEFAESRPYQPGDDVRNLHWRVMARTGKPFTKQFREERERPVFVWVDLRNRMFFATRGAYKAVIAARAAALIGWAALRHGDRIGGVIFSDGVHIEVKPGRGKAAVLHLVRQMAGHPAWDDRTHSRESADDTAPGAAREAVIRLRRVARPGSLVVLLSDFADLDSAAENNLARLARHSELMLMQIYDDIEAELPPPGTYRLSDGADEFVLDTSDPDYRAWYARRFSEHQARVRTLAQRHGMTYLSCRTGQDPAVALRAGLGARRAA